VLTYDLVRSSARKKQLLGFSASTQLFQSSYLMPRQFFAAGELDAVLTHHWRGRIGK